MLADGPGRRSLGNTAEIVRDRLDRLVAPRRHRQGQRRGPRLARAGGRRPPTPSTPPPARWAERGPALVLVTDGGAPLRIARPGHAVLHWRTPRGRRRRHRRRRRLAGRGAAHRAAGRPASPTAAGAGGAARRGPAAPGRRRRPGRRPELHAGRRRPAHAGGVRRRPRGPMTRGRHRRRRLRRALRDGGAGAAAGRARPVLGHRHPARCTTRCGSTSSAASAPSRGRPAGRTSATSWAW